MKLDILTLTFALSVSCITQVIAIFVQYKVNKTYHGIGWWLAGAFSMALGFIFLPMMYVESLYILSRFANPLVILGHICLYIGITQFLEREESKWLPLSIYFAFILSYMYYIYVDNEISGRTVVVSTAVSVVSLMSAYKLFYKRDKLISVSTNFTATVYLVHGCFMLILAIYTIISPPIQSYVDFVNAPLHMVTYIIPIITSALWTFGFIIMVNQSLNAVNREEREKMQLVFNTSPDAALITRMTDGLFIDVNEGFTVITGYSRDEMIGNNSNEFNLWLNTEDRQSFLTELEEHASCENMEFVFQRKDGSQIFGMISARIITIHNQPHIISVVRDITERKRAEEAIRESEETYRSILNASPDDITITDMDGNILIISPAANKMFGFESGEGHNLQFLNFIVPEEHKRARANIIQTCQGNYMGPNEYHGVRKDGTIFDIEVNSGVVRGVNGQPTKMVFVVRDNTERKQSEHQIQTLIQQLECEKNIAQLNSITDSLTGLPNRRRFDEVLHAEFFRLKRSGAPLSLIMMDVDHFKKFNDYYGHIAGDTCLKQIGDTLNSIVGRIPDFAARYGGEEFVVILPETEEEGAVILAAKIRRAVEQLAIPHAASETSDVVTISLGVTTVFTTSLTTPEQIIEIADEALYQAKQGGRNQVVFAKNKSV